MNRTVQLVLIILAVLFLIGSLPAWPYSTGWGYYPSGGLFFVLLVLVLVVALDERKNLTP